VVATTGAYRARKVARRSDGGNELNLIRRVKILPRQPLFPSSPHFVLYVLASARVYLAMPCTREGALMRSPRSVGAIALVAAIFVVSACGSGAAASPTPPSTATPTSVASAPTQATSVPSLPAATAASPTGTAIHLVKNCSTFTAEIPSYCVVSASDLAVIPVGAKVTYLGPLLDNPYFLSSNVRIDGAKGNTATGYCIFDGRPTEERGFCTFWAGTGALAGFTAILKVTIDAQGEWHLDGQYYGNPPSPGPS